MIWCYECNNDFESIIENQDCSPVTEKMEKFMEGMKQLFFNNNKQF